MNTQTTETCDSTDTAFNALMVAATVFGGAALVVLNVEPAVA